MTRPLRVKGHALRSVRFTLYRDYIAECSCGDQSRAATRRMAERLYRDHKLEVKFAVAPAGGGE